MTGKNVNNLTNNRVESMNQQLKRVIRDKLDFLDFWMYFFIFLKSRITQRNSEIIDMKIKKPLQTTHDLKVDEYFTKLIPYAFEYVNEEFKKTKTVIEMLPSSGGSYIILFKGINVCTTNRSCTCYTFESMCLPCRHILYVRSQEKLPLYSEDLCDERWKKTYYFENSIVYRKKDTRTDNKIASLKRKNDDSNLKSVSKDLKRMRLIPVLDSLQISVMDSSDLKYDIKLETLEKIDEAWKCNKKVKLLITDEKISSNSKPDENTEPSNGIKNSNKIKSANNKVVSKVKLVNNFSSEKEIPKLSKSKNKIKTNVLSDLSQDNPFVELNDEKQNRIDKYIVPKNLTINYKTSKENLNEQIVLNKEIISKQKIISTQCK